MLLQLKILEVGGGSGANFKFFNVPAVVDIVGKACCLHRLPELEFSNKMEIPEVEFKNVLNNV
jgi:hypothetical protein